jgi:hypothetical protein
MLTYNCCRYFMNPTRPDSFYEQQQNNAEMEYVVCIGE